MELNETNICVDRVSVAISSEMFDNYVFWKNLLEIILITVNMFLQIQKSAFSI